MGRAIIILPHLPKLTSQLSPPSHWCSRFLLPHALGLHLQKSGECGLVWWDLIAGLCLAVLGKSWSPLQLLRAGPWAVCVGWGWGNAGGGGLGGRGDCQGLETSG